MSKSSQLNLNVIKSSKAWFTLSGILILASLFFILQSWSQFGSPVRAGLDFTGGSKLEYQFSSNAGDSLNSESLQVLLNDLGLDGSRVMVSQDSEPVVILRTRAISDDPISEKLNEALAEKFGEFKILSIDTVSPVIGPELFRSGLIALVLTILGIIIYISTRFRRDYAACAIVALFHDVLITLGFFAFLGLYYGVEVNSLFITAVLTVFGFSVHDTIVVFDRIRENQKLQTKNFSFSEVADLSVNQVAVRSLNTSITTLTVLAFLFFLGGKSTELFVAAMFVGMLTGTYSSIFLASPLLVTLRTRAAS